MEDINQEKSNFDKYYNPATFVASDPLPTRAKFPDFAGEFWQRVDKDVLT